MKKSMMFSVLIMVGMTASLSFALEPYQTLGCWKDAIPRVMQSLEGNSNVGSILNGHYKRRENAVKKCYQAALSLGFRVFALQDGGQCFSSSSAGSTYNSNGQSTDCLKDGAGGPMANEVYKMIDGFIKANQNSITVNKGDSYTLLCEFPHVKISHVGNAWACAWKMPNGQVLSIWPEVKHEREKIKQHGNLENQCGITIKNAEQSDNGKWQCQMAYVDKDNNAIPKQRDIGVVVANINP